MISALHESHKYFSLWLNWSVPNRAAKSGFGSHLGGEYKPLLNSALLLCSHCAADGSQTLDFSMFWAKIFIISKLTLSCGFRLSCLAIMNQRQSHHSSPAHEPAEVMTPAEGADPKSSQWAASGPFLVPVPLYPGRRWQERKTAGPQIHKLNLSTIQPTITVKSLILTVSDRIGLTSCH